MSGALIKSRRLTLNCLHPTPTANTDLSEHPSTKCSAQVALASRPQAPSISFARCSVALPAADRCTFAIARRLAQTPHRPRKHESSSRMAPVLAHRSRSRRSSSSSERSPLLRAALLDAMMVAPSVSRSAPRCASRSACTVAIAAHISTLTRALPAAHQHHTQRSTAASQRDLTSEQVQNSCSICMLVGSAAVATLKGLSPSHRGELSDRCAQPPCACSFSPQPCSIWCRPCLHSPFRALAARKCDLPHITLQRHHSMQTWQRASSAYVR